MKCYICGEGLKLGRCAANDNKTFCFSCIRDYIEMDMLTKIKFTLAVEARGIKWSVQRVKGELVVHNAL